MIGYLNGAKILTDKNFNFGGTNLITGTGNFDALKAKVDLLTKN